MEKDTIHALYTYLDETAILLEKHASIPYLEGVAEAGDNLFHQAVSQQVDHHVKEMLTDKLSEVEEHPASSEEIRKAFQLAILKGMKGSVQPHHSMTPDAVCLFMSYLVNKVNEKKETPKTLLDLAVGSGNLMNAILNNTPIAMHALGFEVDETLLKLAFVSANLQQHEVNLFHRDSIEALPIEEVDFVVTDVPVGFYPKDEISKSYELKQQNGHSYLHHLLVEQALNVTKDGGYLFFIMPNNQLHDETSPPLYHHIKKHANVLGLLQLPASMFHSQKHTKSILMLQKKADWVKQPNQALLAELPSFSNKEALAQMIQRINHWCETELAVHS